MIRRALRDARREAELSQTKLAKAVGIGRDHYGRVERGEEPLPDVLAVKLADVLNVDPWEIKPDFEGATEKERAVLQGLRRISRHSRESVLRIILAMLDEASRSNAA